MGLLEKLLSGKGGEPGPRPSLDPERLNTSEQIGRVLHELLDARKQVTMLLEGSDETFTSSILQVDTGTATLELDELNPRGGHERLTRIREFRLITRHHGVDISFHSQVTHIDSSGGIAVYTAAFPTILRYQPRRAAYRAEVELSERIPVFLQTEGGGLLQGELRDISVGGLGLELVRRPVVDVEKGQRIGTCTIRLRDGEQITGSLEICFVGQAAIRQRLRLGGRFVDMEPQNNKAVRKLVADIDRRRIKHRRDR
ncbi:MAG: flagellar regulator YcgR PilZN domain-containing protein [Gammaproteobacteria bacterium]|nr:flagellar regulator YcgR PilZN domain-containing protein [Gammaproteobacteria bacterium]